VHTHSAAIRKPYSTALPGPLLCAALLGLVVYSCLITDMYFCSDKQFPALGFGGKLPDGTISHEFFLVSHSDTHSHAHSVTN